MNKRQRKKAASRAAGSVYEATRRTCLLNRALGREGMLRRAAVERAGRKLSSYPPGSVRDGPCPCGSGKTLAECCQKEYLEAHRRLLEPVEVER